MRILRFTSKANRDAVYNILKETVSVSELQKAENDKEFDVRISDKNKSNIEFENFLSALAHNYFGKCI